MIIPESVKNKAKELDAVIASSGLNDENVEHYQLPAGYDGKLNPYWVARGVVEGILGEAGPGHLQGDETEQDMLDTINQLIVWIQQMKLIAA